MLSAWGASYRADRHAVPVEMRFIDMFMAALGALIFMAMLLAFLLRYLPPEGTVLSPGDQHSFKAEPFTLLTRTLAPAKVGEPYEVAFAYRGGTAPVSWEIAAGSQEIPAGMRFDASQGVLSGTPKSLGTVRFVVLARDAAKGSEERPFELTIEPPPKSSRQIEKWLAISMLAVLGLLWLINRAAIWNFKHTLFRLKDAFNRGLQRVEITTGIGTKELIELPEGIETYEGRLRAAKMASRFFLLVIVVFTAWLIWRLRHG